MAASNEHYFRAAGVKRQCYPLPQMHYAIPMVSALVASPSDSRFLELIRQQHRLRHSALLPSGHHPSHGSPHGEAAMAANAVLLELI